MPTLLTRTARLALDSGGPLRDELIAALRLASDDEEEEEESDALAKFEKGKKVPVSQLPEALQDNVQNPPAAVRELSDQMEGKTARLDGNRLDGLVRATAKDGNFAHWQNATATPAVKAAAAVFTRAVSKALSVYVQQDPPADQATVGDLMDADGAWHTFRVLDGENGLWDGQWKRFYRNTNRLERFLGRVVIREYKALKAALEDAAFETAGA